MTSDTTQAPTRPASKPGKENLENILPLLPLQRALMFHSENSQSDPGFLQVRATVQGALERELFEEAWRRVMTWHPGLRMTVHASDGRDPRAVIWREVALPWTYRDLRPSRDQKAEIAALLERDRREGIDLGDPPAMRVNLLRTADQRHELIWTCHHLFVDGWSSAVVLEDVLDVYRALVAGSKLEPRVPASVLYDYYRWRLRDDQDAAREFWTKRLDGFGGAPSVSTVPADDGDPGEVTVVLDPRLTEGIKVAAADMSVTPNAIIQGAWALMLASLFSSDDVVFGTTVGGRSVAIDGIERAVGYFANVVPIRTRIDPSISLREWLRGLRDDQFEMQGREHCTLSDIHAWSGLPGHKPLFETFLVVENFPAGLGQERSEVPAITEFRSDLTTSYPLTVGIALGDDWVLGCKYDVDRLDREGARRLLDGFESLLHSLASGSNSTVAKTLTGSRAQGLRDMLVEADSSQNEREFTAPRDETEMKVARIWSEVLGLDDISVHDDYFALGGSSILAVRLFSRIEQELGVALPLRTLLDRPTIAGMAQMFTDPSRSTRPEFRSLVPIQVGGTKPPIVCVHAGGAHVLFYRHLAKRLGRDQPVYGLEPVGLDGTVKPLESIPAMAALYVEELRRAQPHGPYRFVGYCMGGAVSLEMARQLEAEGEVVALITVLDSGLPIEPNFAASQGDRVHKELSQRGVLGLSAFLARAAAVRARRLWRLTTGSGGGRLDVYHELVERGCRRAFHKYVPAKTEASILLIRSTHFAESEEKDYHLRWSELTPKLHVGLVESRHERILEEPAVQHVARLILDHVPDL